MKHFFKDFTVDDSSLLPMLVVLVGLAAFTFIGFCLGKIHERHVVKKRWSAQNPYKAKA